MDHRKHLRSAGVPTALHPEALASLRLARERAKGLTRAKWKVRLLKAGKIAKLLEWGDNRLCEKHPELAGWDIAPMRNITAHGDHVEWMETPDGGRPNPDCWLNPDPTSEEYRRAVALPRSQRYFGGHHPRSKAARKAWYRRNAGEYMAWERGAPIAEDAVMRVWRGPGVRVCCADGAWIVVAERALFGPWKLRTRTGFEVDNVFSESLGARIWYPIPGHALRAPATHSVIPGKSEL